MLKGLVWIAVLLICGCGIAYGVVNGRAYVEEQHERNWAQIRAKQVELGQALQLPAKGSKAQRQEHEHQLQALRAEVAELEQREAELTELPTDIMIGAGVILVFAAHPLLCWMVARRKRRNLVAAVLGGLFLPPLALGYYCGLRTAQADLDDSSLEQSNPLNLVFIVLFFQSYGIGYVIGSLQKPLPLTPPQR